MLSSFCAICFESSHTSSTVTPCLETRKKIKGAKKSCEKRPGYKRRCSLVPHDMQSDFVSHMRADLVNRKSDYCDEWMYWVAVKVRGSNKCRGYKVCVGAYAFVATVFARKPNLVHLFEEDQTQHRRRDLGRRRQRADGGPRRSYGSFPLRLGGRRGGRQGRRPYV